MGLTYVAQLPLGAPFGLVPSVWLSVGQQAVGLNASLQGNLALNASLTAAPPTLASALSVSADFTTACQLALNPEWLVPPFTPPLSVSFSVSDVVSLQASLSLSLSLYLPALNALLAAAAGIYAFSYVGTGTGLGGAVTTELATTWPDGAPTSGSTTALIFGAVSPGARTNLPAFIGGIPYSSGLVYGGKIGISALCPLIAPAAAQGTASLNAALAASASLSAAASLGVTTFATMLANQALFYANLQAVGQVALPKFAIQATASAAAGLSAHFGASCNLGAVIGDFGSTFFVYTYTGAANAMGAALTSALSSHWGDGVTPTSGACTAVVLGATDSLSIATMLGFFNGA